MEIIICQTCGAILKCTETQCVNCGAVASVPPTTVTPAQGGGTAHNFSFFEDAVPHNDNDAADPVSGQENWPDAEEEYVLSRSTVSSSSQLTPPRNQPDPKSPTELTLEDSTKPQRLATKQKLATDISPRKKSTEIKRFTDKHMAIVFITSLVVIAIFGVMFVLQSGYQISITWPKASSIKMEMCLAV